MAILGGLGVKLSMNLAEWSKNIKSVTKDINSIQKTVGGFKNAVVGAFAVDQLASFGKAIFDITAQFQTFEVTLTNTLGTKSSAKKALEEVRQFATETPFAVAEVSAAYTRWANQGLTPTIDRMKKLGDVASALGGGFEQTAEAFKDLAVGQTKRIEELGILATQTGGKIQLSFKGQNLEIEKNAEGVQKALDYFSSLNGVVGTTSAISETFSGKLSNLKDNFDNLLLTIGNKNEGLIKGFLDLGITAISSFNNAISNNVQNVIDERNEINALGQALLGTNENSLEREKLMGIINSKYPELLKNFKDEVDFNDQLKNRLRDVNAYYTQKIALVAAQSKEQEILAEISKEIDKQVKLRIRLAEITQDAGKQGTTMSAGRTLELGTIPEEIKKSQEEVNRLQLQLNAYLVEVNKSVKQMSNTNWADLLKELELKSNPNPNPNGNGGGTEEAKKYSEEWWKQYLETQDYYQKRSQILFEKTDLTSIAKKRQKNEKDVSIGVEELFRPFKEEVSNQFNNLFDNVGKSIKPIDIKVNPIGQLFSEEFWKDQDRLAQTEGIINAVNASFKGAAEDGLAAFGNALGGVFTGQIKFGDAILIGLKRFLGTFAKLLVGYGTASEAFKKGFEDPYVAIAAGIALGALAGAIGNLNKGGVGSSSSGVGSGFERMTSSGFSQNINVTGKLIGSGRDLVAVIGTTGFDNKYTKVP